MPPVSLPGRTRRPSRNGDGLNHETNHEITSHEFTIMMRVVDVVTRNLGWKLLSIGLAVLLWIAVEGEPELVTVQTVPVFYRNVEPSLALVSNPPPTVRVELRGPSDVLGSDNLSNVAVLLDLAGADEPGERIFPISHTNVSLPSGVNFVRSDPSELRLHLDRAPADRAGESKGSSVPKQ